MHDHPATTRPIEEAEWAHEGPTAQQRFEQERRAAAERGGSALAGLLHALHGVLGRGDAAVPPTGQAATARHLEGLAASGCVTLHGLRTPSGRHRVEHVVVAPGGIYILEDRPWRGQVAVNGDELYVDGRLRAGVPEAALRTAAAVQQALDDELSPLGLSVTPVLCLPTVPTPWQRWTVQGVMVVCGRGMARLVRHAPPLMGADTVVRLALAADRLLERERPVNRR